MAAAQHSNREMKFIMKYLLTIALWMSATMSASHCLADEKTDLQNERYKIGYSIGYQVGSDFRKIGIEILPEMMLRGIKDAQAGTSPLMTREQMRSVLVELKQKTDAEQEREKKAAVEGYRGEGRDFLAANAKKEDVVTRPSGLQYKILREGTGRQPTLEDIVTVNYIGTRIDGVEFDNTYRAGKPATFTLDNVIPGWKEAIPLMKEGGKWQIFLPAELAFGERGPLADRAVIFEVELLSVQPPEEQPPQETGKEKASP